MEKADVSARFLFENGSYPSQNVEKSMVWAVLERGGAMFLREMDLNSAIQMRENGNWAQISANLNG
jgi:hypothetical protein